MFPSAGFVSPTDAGEVAPDVKVALGLVPRNPPIDSRAPGLRENRLPKSPRNVAEQVKPVCLSSASLLQCAEFALASLRRWDRLQPGWHLSICGDVQDAKI